MFNKNQTIGTIIFMISSSLALLWEKSFAYANFLDTFLGMIAAVGIGLIFKVLPLKTK